MKIWMTNGGTPHLWKATHGGADDFLEADMAYHGHKKGLDLPIRSGDSP